MTDSSKSTPMDRALAAARAPSPLLRIDVARRAGVQQPGGLGGTYAGNPLAVAAAHAGDPLVLTARCENHLYGVDDAAALRQSDAVCSALQLINFWQDLSVDLPRKRFYIPEAIRSEEEAARWDKSWKVSTEVISGEDFTQQQNIHLNLASGRLPGVVFGQNEPMLSHYHRELNKLTGVPDAALP